MKSVGDVWNRNIFSREMPDGMRRDGPMNHVKINVVRLQPPQTGFAMFDQCARLGVGRADFGGNDTSVAGNRPQCFAQRGFTRAFVIHFCGVEKIASLIHRAAHDLVHIALTLRAPIVAAAIGKTAHAQDGQFQFVFPAAARVHG